MARMFRFSRRRFLGVVGAVGAVPRVARAALSQDDVDLALSFYLDGGYPKAAILRIESALRRYPDSGREAELLLVLGQTHLELGNALRARQTFERVVKEFGANLEARRAQLFLDFIRQKHGDNPKDADAHG